MQNKPRPKLLKLSEVRRHPELQPRASIDPAIVEEYRDAIKDGAKFPAVTLFFDKLYYYLADGWHRYEAHQAAGVGEIQADVYEGSFRDAKLYALGANGHHGLRRTNEDKRRAVGMLLADAEWSKWSDREIARHLRVSAPLVGSVRNASLDENPVSPASESSSDVTVNSYSEDRTYKTKHGTEAVMNTANIGRKPAEKSSTDSSAEAQSDTASFRGDTAEDSSKAEEEKDFEAYLNGLHKEIEDLRRQNESLAASDSGAEIRNLTQRLINEENQRKDAEERLQLRKKDLNRFGVWFSELRKLLDVKEDREVVGRVRALMEAVQ